MAANPELLLSRTVAVIGYGNQGRAQALNLRDSGVPVLVGLPEGSATRARALEDGMEVLDTPSAAVRGDLAVLLTSDSKMPEVYRDEIQPAMRRGKALVFAHGFNIVYGQIEPPPEVDVILVSPKGVGAGVRAKYLEGPGVPSLAAVHQDASGMALDLALAYAWGIGAARSLILETTFREETETDLFGEQAVLCGGIPELIKAAYSTLVDAGYSPEVAYFECVHETKLIVDLIVERGIAGMREAISDTAQWGGLTAGPRLVDGRFREELGRLLGEIRDGEFARDWLEEGRSGAERLAALKSAEASLELEGVGSRIRAQVAGRG